MIVILFNYFPHYLVYLHLEAMFAFPNLSLAPVGMPSKCMPSPRTAARVDAAARLQHNKAGCTPALIRRPFMKTTLLEIEGNSGGEDADDESDGSPPQTPRRSYPVCHPPMDPPLCSVSFNLFKMRFTSILL